MTLTRTMSLPRTSGLKAKQGCERKPYNISPTIRNTKLRLDLFNISTILVTLTLTLTVNLKQVQGQFTCGQPGYNEIIPWRPQPVNKTVSWRLDHVCSGTVQCYGPTSQGGGDQPLDAQLCPAQLQVGDSLFLLPPPVGSPYTTTVVNVSESAFYTCPSRAYPPDQILQNSNLSQTLHIPQRFLTPGVLYLAQHPDGAFSNCNYGLRIKVLVKDQSCRASPLDELCSGRGVCGSKFLEESYRCYCYEDYRTAYCTEFDACASGPCQNGARCVDGDQGLLGSDFLCICAEGFTGPSCSEVLGQCSPGVCGNGSCVAVSQIAFTCNCRQGFTGTFCDKFTDMCTPNPCQNGAVCVSRFMNYACQCQPGYSGSNCEVNLDECASNPCAAGSTCVDDVNGFYCRCPPGFDSDLCSDPINYCDSSPCENAATCLPVLNGFVCNCSLGFQGDRCQTIISQCSQAPGICQHGGHCLQSPGGPIQCQCSPGWTGTICEKLDNLCRFNPCPNGTVCIDTSSELRPGTYLCSCPPGFTGSRCEAEIEECSSSPCINGGVCVDRLAGYDCICPQGYTGTNCETNINMCEGRGALLCQNNATCVDGDVGFSYTCVCAPGYTSVDCSADINECASTPCLYNATCRDRVNGYSCLCPDGFSGQNCQIYFNYCSLQPCRNGARCISEVGSYRCACAPGWTGQNCTQDIDECDSSPCLNGATCQNLQNQFRCVCPPDFFGPQCERRINDCTPTSCINGGTCVDLVNSFQCICAPGYTGRNCATDVAECLSTPCLNGGICQDLVNGYRCFCDVNLWAGTHCEIPLNNCSSNPCFNDVECRPISSTDFTCVCPPRYTGRLCETLVELCTVSSCLNGATCRENLVTLTYECICPVGYYGERCENDRDFCVGHNCRNGATCQDGETGYTCLCKPGFTGERCETDIDDCASQPCKNGALCEDSVNGFRCFCVNGYTGIDCSQEANECLSAPCLNGGRCVDSFNQFTCFCAAGYTGLRCEINIDDCVNHVCRNGALCIDGLNDYTCRCLPGYIGADCSFEINECLSSPCDSVGTLLCNDQVAGYTCACRVGYTGRRCETQINECGSRPCQNGATCTDLIGTYSCRCRVGFTGANCESAIDDCASNPCGRGTCQRNAGTGFTCLCPNDGRLYDTRCNPILPCTSNPCQNQGTCVNEGQNYRCLCRFGFTGPNCAEADYCKISNVSCANGGLCVNVQGNFTCVCTAGYEGRFCEVNSDDCQNNFCANGATCVDIVNGYECQCRPGYVSQYCQNVATSCIEEPCYNGATCISSPNFLEGTLFTCVCPSGYEGAYCHLESNECASNPCQNGGTCSQGRGVFSCTCKPGYTGRTCSEDIDECQRNVCQNGATCVDQVNGYICQCPVGYTGVYCQSEILECSSSPCQNGGQCVDGADGYQCFCRNGFTGIHCELDYDECLSAPCQNEATCVNAIARFDCLCQPGVTGVLCESNIDECSSSPCRNGATCTDLFNGFNCTCPPGYTGVQCETDIDECESSPCQNGGTCRDREGMYVCDCVQPYRGVNCDLLPCDLNPCESGGTCYNDLSRLPDGFRCDCIEGLTGTRCQSNIDDCARTDGTPQCSGRGLCLDDINKYICLCQPGWKGQDCEVPIDECTNNNCRNNATCVNLWTGYRCACAVGYEGQFCERETDECEPNPCRNGATCVDLHNDYRCLCREGWTGKDCNTEVNECRLTGSNPCFNGGTCIDSFATYTCQCPAFYTGRRCETRYDPCDNNNYQCQREAPCRTQPDGTYICVCPRGYTGTNCEIDIDECASSPCVNGGRCEDQSAGFRCYCPLGYTGTRCEINIDDCLYCQNGATCQDLVNGYICTCTEGYRGQNCTEDVNECDAQPYPCRNGGTCTNTYGSYVCICKPGYTGTNCEIDIDECASSPCENGAICQQGFGDFTCFCQLGYTGRLCEVDIDDCTPNPCNNGRCSDRVNSFTCTCDAGWTGSRCTININECASQPCLNGATCRDGINGFTCSCREGFTGPRCELDVEVCQRGGVSQCLNGGTCNEGPGTLFTCICKPGYTGRFCQTNIDECGSAPCKNGGTCQDGFDEFTCDCKSGWSGEDCSIDIDECLSYPCINKGICQQQRPGWGYECLCRSGFGGVNCEINYDDCVAAPCLNGGTCVDGLNEFTCICPSHTTGRTCETLIVTPTPSVDPSTRSVSMSTTSVTQSSTGVVSTLDVDGSAFATLDGTSVLSGTVVTSAVEEDSVSFISTPSSSDTFILEPSQSIILVSKETDSPLFTMTTTSMPESSEMDVTTTASVDSSFDFESDYSSVSTPVLPVSSLGVTTESPSLTSVITLSTNTPLVPSMSEESAIYESNTFQISTATFEASAINETLADFKTSDPAATLSISDDVNLSMLSSATDSLFPVPYTSLYETYGISTQASLTDIQTAINTHSIDSSFTQSTSELYSQIAIAASLDESFIVSSMSAEQTIVPTAALIATESDISNAVSETLIDHVNSDLFATSIAMPDLSTNLEFTDTLQSPASQTDTYTDVGMTLLASQSEDSADSTLALLPSTPSSAIISPSVSSSSSITASLMSMEQESSDLASTESAIFPSMFSEAHTSVLLEAGSEYQSSSFVQSAIESSSTPFLTKTSLFGTSVLQSETSSDGIVSLSPSSFYSNPAQSTEGIQSSDLLTPLLDREKTSILPTLPSEIMSSSMMSEIRTEISAVDVSESLETLSDEISFIPSSVYSDYSQMSLTDENLSGILSSSLPYSKEATPSPSDLMSSSSVMTETLDGTSLIDVPEIPEIISLYMPISPSSLYSEYTQYTMTEDVSSGSLSSLLVIEEETSILPSLSSDILSSVMMTQSLEETSDLETSQESTVTLNGVSDVMQTTFMPTTTLYSSIATDDAYSAQTLSSLMSTSNYEDMLSTPTLPDSISEEVGPTMSIDLPEVISELSKDASYLFSSQLESTMHESLSLHLSVTASLDVSAPPETVTSTDFVTVARTVESTMNVYITFKEASETVSPVDESSLEIIGTLDLSPSITESVLVTETASLSSATLSPVMSSSIEVVTEDLTTSSIDANSSLHVDESFLTDTPYSESVMLSTTLSDYLLTEMFSTPNVAATDALTTGSAAPVISHTESSTDLLESDDSTMIEPSIMITDTRLALASSMQDFGTAQSSLDATMIRPTMSAELFSSDVGPEDSELMSEELVTDSFMLTPVVSETQSFSASSSASVEETLQSVLPSTTSEMSNFETEVFQTNSASKLPSSSIEVPFASTLQTLPPADSSSVPDIHPTATLIIDSTDMLTASDIETDMDESSMIDETVLPSISASATETIATDLLSMRSIATDLLSAATVFPSQSDEISNLPSKTVPDETSFLMEATQTNIPETTLLVPSVSSGEETSTQVAVESTKVLDETVTPSDSSLDFSDTVDVLDTSATTQTLMIDTLLPSLSSMFGTTTAPTESLPTELPSVSPSSSEDLPLPSETALVLPQFPSSVAESEIPITSSQSISPTSTIIPEVTTTEIVPSVEPTEMPPTTIDSESTPTSSMSSPTSVTTDTPTSTSAPMSCSDRPCYNNATCVDVLAGGVQYYFCDCSSKYRGVRCEEPRVYDPMRFSGTSLLTFDPIPLQSENTIQLTLRTNQGDGVIFYSALDYTVSDSTHYIRLLVRDGLLVYQFSCKIQSFELESNVEVNTGELFNITISQSDECKAQLDVSGPGSTTSVEVGMPFVFETLYLTRLSTFYVGGVPGSVSYVPGPAPNLTGCISVIDINGRSYGFFEARDAYQVKECDGVLPTAPPPLPPVSTVSPSPLPTCDDVTCQNGATCRQVLTPGGQTTYRCDCPLHFVGRHCEQEIGISFPFFSGQSYLQHPDLDFSGRPSNDLYLTFKTRAPRGSLLYAETSIGEFVHLLVEDGFLKYQASCGPTNVVFVDTRVTVNYDNLTAVNVRQTESESGDCTVAVTVDSHAPTVVTLSLTPSQLPRMFDLGPLYLGGLPPGGSPVPRATPFTNYVGCIRHLQVNGEERLVFQDAVAGQNIEECDVPFCQYQPCYNNATCLPSVEGYSCECLPSYTGALCERTACDRNPCQHGGTCIHLPDNGDYVCVCPQGRHGVNCEQALSISRAEYFGSRLGYTSFTAYPPLAGLDYMFDFRFSFTLHQADVGQDGLMVFAGQQAANPKYGADFFAVGLKDGFLHFHYNLGSGPALLRSVLPVDTSLPVHQVRFGRDRRNGYLKLDGQANATGSSGGTLQGLNIFSNLYVGGFDNYDVPLPSDVIFTDGFRGCLYDVEVRTGTNGQWRPPGAVLTGRNVGQCQRPECDLSDCRNGATCIDLGATHRCACVVGFKGPTCADVTTPCDGIHDCSEGATCMPLVAGGYTCLCPLGKAGQRCEQEITISDARFVGETSYMAFSHKGSLRFAIDLQMQFKPEVTSGLLLYMAEHLSRRSGDFLSLSLEEGRVQLRYRVGTEPTVVVSSEGTATTGGWHVVTSGRNTTHGYVTLNGRTTWVKVSGEMVGLDVTTPIYVAGVPDLGSVAPSGVEKEPSAFEGCVRSLVVNGQRFTLSEQGAAIGVNVVDCDGTACGYDVCQNGGTCYPRVNGGGFVCGCTKAYVGARCETSVLCEDSPCAGGATCVPDIANHNYSCICPLGRTGADCEKEFTFRDARFTGDSYLFYQDPAYNDSDVTKTDISFNFSTTAYNGVIMWNGQAYSDKDDYLGVGVHRGRARVVVSLGWWTREDVVTDPLVNDGQWHSLIIQRSDRQLKVYVDGTLYDVNLAGQFGGLNTGGGYYFGGFEFDKSIMTETCSHFDTAFVGCLRDVHLHADAPALDLQRATAGTNVQSCDSR